MSREGPNGPIANYGSVGGWEEAQSPLGGYAIIKVSLKFNLVGKVGV